MNFTYENQGNNTYIVYKVGEKDVVDTMSLGMITNNKILGLAPTVFYQQDTTKYFKYNISSKVSADQFLMGIVNRKRLIGVFKGIVNAMLSAEEYMIETNSICLDLQYIFTDVSTCETILICLPIENTEKTPIDLKTFFKNIIFGTQFDQTENCDYVAKLFNHLNSSLVFSLNNFKELLDEIEQDSTKVSVTVAPVVVPEVPSVQPKPVTVESSISVPEVNDVPEVPQRETEVNSVHLEDEEKHNKEKEISFMYLLRNYSKENAALYKAQQSAKKTTKATETSNQNKKERKAKKENKKKDTNAVAMNHAFEIPGQSAEIPKPIMENVEKDSIPTPKSVTLTPPPVEIKANFGETTVLSSSNVGETTVLGASAVMQEIKPYLLRGKNNEKIILNKPVFRIGKEKSYVDYFIGDNTAISRSHANIISRDGEYFVVDTNSTNHTYVNGGMLQSNVETKISHGTKIRLANEDFEFKLY